MGTRMVSRKASAAPQSCAAQVVDLPRQPCLPVLPDRKRSTTCGSILWQSPGSRRREHALPSSLPERERSVPGLQATRPAPCVVLSPYTAEYSFLSARALEISPRLKASCADRECTFAMPSFSPNSLLSARHSSSRERSAAWSPCETKRSCARRKREAAMPRLLLSFLCIARLSS